MSKILTGSFQLMKSLNRSIILNIIRKEGPISRAEIAKMTKLTPPTVSNLVKELLNTGIVKESRQGVSQGGRKPTMLVINSASFHVIGLDVGPVAIKGVLTDLDANILAENENPIDPSINNEELLQMMSGSIAELLNSAERADSDRVLGIGVGMHGIVDVHKGESLYAPILQLHHIPIREHLEEQFQIAVKVENDGRAMALGEAWFGEGDDTGTSVSVNVGRGIGAGVIIDGNLYHGRDFLAGEIGHMTIDIDGPRCSCGNYGCLQAMAAGPYLAERAKREIAMGRQSMIKELVEDLDEITGETIHRCAVEGDPLAVEILTKAGTYLGIGLVNLIHTLNPDRIILGGGVAKAGELLFNSIHDTIQSRGLTEEAKATKILPSKLGDNASAIGAVSLVLVDLFSRQSRTIK